MSFNDVYSWAGYLLVVLGGIGLLGSIVAIGVTLKSSRRVRFAVGVSTALCAVGIFCFAAGDLCYWLSMSFGHSAIAHVNPDNKWQLFQAVESESSGFFRYGLIGAVAPLLSGIALFFYGFSRRATLTAPPAERPA